MNPILATLVHWIHLMAAITALGGTIFLRLVAHPAVQALEGEPQALARRTIIRKTRTLVLHSVTLLLLTGVLNIVRVVSGGLPEGLYGAMLAIKIMLAMALFMIAIALLSSSEAFEKFQQRRPMWLVVNIFIGLTIVLISAWLRFQAPA